MPERVYVHLKIMHMKKIMFLMSAAVLMAACKEPNDEVVEESYLHAFFPDGLPAVIELDPAGSSFEVAIQRADASGELSFVLEASDASGLFTIPREVAFAQGEMAKSLAIGYEYSEEDFPAGKYYEVTLSIPDEFRSDAGAGDYSFEAGVPESDVEESDWESLGYATYTDDIISGLFDTGVVSYEVEIQQNRQTEGLFRLVNPYGAAFPYNEEGSWDSSRDYYLEINATDPDGVYIEEQELGLDWGYGSVLVESLGWYYYLDGSSWDEIKAYGYCGTYDGESISFPARRILAMMPQVDSDYRDSNLNGSFLVVMPWGGDYSVNVSHAGRSSDGSASAIVTLGSGAEYAEVSLYSGKYYDDEEDEEYEEGELIETKTVSESGTVTFDCSESGFYYVTAVTYGNGSARKRASRGFYYSAPEPVWTEYGKNGDYDYSIYWQRTDSGLTLYKNEADPYYFKIANWGEGVDFTFYWNERNDDVWVDDIRTGAEIDGEPLYVVDFTYYDGDPDPWSYFESNKFIFKLTYYTDGRGIIVSDREYEYFTFTLDEAAELDDLLGTYDVYEKSAYYDDAYETPVTWVIEASDDESKGNIMMTVFDNFECQTPIYGTFTGSTGTFRFDSGQCFYEYTDATYGAARLYFESYDGDYVTFTMDGAGAFSTDEMFQRRMYYGVNYASKRIDDQYFSAEATRVD